MNNNNEKLSFSSLGLESDAEVEEIENPSVDFVSELPTLGFSRKFQYLDVTSIQNCQKVSKNWNNAIIEMKSSVSVSRLLESDAATFRETLRRQECYGISPAKP